MKRSQSYNTQILQVPISLAELPSASQEKVTLQRKGDEVLIKQLKTPATLLDFLFSRWFSSD